jgi:predicted DNA-binding transcriptional regulator AlpA
VQTLLKQRDAATICSLSERTLERLRVSGAGPKFVRLGKSVRYRLVDLEEWIASRVVSTVSSAMATALSFVMTRVRSWLGPVQCC